MGKLGSGFAILKIPRIPFVVGDGLAEVVMRKVFLLLSLLCLLLPFHEAKGSSFQLLTTPQVFNARFGSFFFPRFSGYGRFGRSLVGRFSRVPRFRNLGFRRFVSHVPSFRGHGFNRFGGYGFGGHGFAGASFVNPQFRANQFDAVFDPGFNLNAAVANQFNRNTNFADPFGTVTPDSFGINDGLSNIQVNPNDPCGLLFAVNTDLDVALDNLVDGFFFDRKANSCRLGRRKSGGRNPYPFRSRQDCERTVVAGGCRFDPNRFEGNQVIFR